MKKYVVLVTILLGIGMSSCKKEDTVADGVPYSGYVLSKYNGDYEHFVMVGYSAEKNKLVAYPDSSDCGTLANSSHITKCSNDYFLDTYVLGDPHNLVKKNTAAYTNITVDEYKEIWRASEGKDIRDTLASRIIDTDPYKEIYIIMRADTILCQGKYQEPNYDKINEMIESGEFFTYEGVERVK